MCGRYYIDSAAAKAFGGKTSEDGSGNRTACEMCPGMKASVLRMNGRSFQWETMSWGFENQSGQPVINARLETMRQRAMFSALADRQRCAVPASGYFEWRRSDRQKYAVSLDGVNPIYLAGLYRMGERGMEFVVLTQAPVDSIRRFHDRMPVLLRDENAVAEWLSGRLEPGVANESGVVIRALGNEQLQMDI